MTPPNAATQNTKKNLTLTKETPRERDTTPEPTWSFDPAQILKESYRTVRKHGRPMTITALRQALVKSGVNIPGQESTQDSILNSVLRLADENYLRLQRRLGVCTPDMMTVEGDRELRDILRAKGLSDDDILEVFRSRAK